MESKDLDQLFRDGLEQEFQFHNQEEQWAEIATELRPEGEKRFWWWYILMGVLVVGLGFGGWIFGQKETLSTASNVVEATTPENLEVIVEETASESELNLDLKKIAPTSSKPINQIQHRREEVAPVDHMERPVQNTIVSEPPIIANNDILVALPLTKVEAVHSENDFTYDYRSDISTAATSKRQLSRSSLDALSALPVIVHPIPISLPELPAEPTIMPSTKENGRLLSVSSGLQWQSTLDTAIEESSKAVPYIGISVQLHPRWQGRLRYAKTSVQRNTQQTPATYNIPLVEVPVDFTTPNRTELRYEQQQLEAGLSYRLLSFSKLRSHLLAGAQFAKNSNINTIYAYQNVYQSPVVEASLDNQSWHLSAIFTGVNIEIPIISRLSTTATYQYYWHTHSENFRWQNNQQLYFGLNYQF